MKCHALVLVQPSALKQKKTTTKRQGARALRDEDGQSEHQASSESDVDNEDLDDDQVMHEFLTSDKCVWSIIDGHYNNPEHGGEFSSVLYGK